MKHTRPDKLPSKETSFKVLMAKSAQIKSDSPSPNCPTTSASPISRGDPLPESRPEFQGHELSLESTSNRFLSPNTRFFLESVAIGVGNVFLMIVVAVLAIVGVVAVIAPLAYLVLAIGGALGLQPEPVPVFIVSGLFALFSGATIAGVHNERLRERDGK